MNKIEFKHKVLLVLNKVNRVLTELGAGAAYAIKK
jgi:hypothetical protein